MFRAGGKWRHINSLDLDMVVVKVDYIGLSHSKLKVLYWNRNFKKLVTPEIDTVKVQVKDFQNWNQVKDDTIIIR